MSIVFNKFEKKAVQLNYDGEPLRNENLKGVRTPIVETSDTAEALKQLNDDSVNNNKMSAIDMRSRLHNTELSGILAIDTWVTFGALPVRCLDFTQRKKRLAVSLNGEGRKEMINLVSGKKEADEARAGFGDRLRTMFGIKPNNPGGQQ